MKRLIYRGQIKDGLDETVKAAMQEEKAFLGGKYEIIAMHENLLFGYQEFPNVIEEPLAPKKLNTTGTPVNWNDSRMDLHFQPWEDGHLYFKHIEPILTYYQE